jgi:hypothetical protein
MQQSFCIRAELCGRSELAPSNFLLIAVALIVARALDARATQ